MSSRLRGGTTTSPNMFMELAPPHMFQQLRRGRGGVTHSEEVDDVKNGIS